MRHRITFFVSLVGVLISVAASADSDFGGFLVKDGKALFPIGFYELPGDDAGLRAMADASANIIRCGSRADLDRVEAVGMLGWVPLPLHTGVTDELRRQVAELVDHPALAVWEGPDEVVWNFTAFSGLHKSMGVYENANEWWEQTPRAIEYSESEAARIIPNMRASAELIRSIDGKRRPVWMNEALRSDARFVRQYLPFIDVVGCDIYPVKTSDRNIERMGSATDRWMQIAKGKPVWMVLQAFSWDELGAEYADRGNAYPAFAESRFMAYDVIAHGARGIMYWGSHYLKSDACRWSIYSLVSELAALNSFLVAQDEAGVKLELIELTDERTGLGVHMIVRRSGEDWLIAIVNEDGVARMGVEISGLSAIDGRDVMLLYGDETHRVSGGEIIVRLQPKEVKVYCTSRAFESERREYRDFAGK
ncbi:MAG: hypothetical protein HUU46_03955 [Candidatus Hydrogenedentes bacterium]|nr:hypothetical protein [Candidatus Hydrogenedentota bacterium]